MRYLLDTCVVSEVVKPVPEPSVLDWLGRQEEQQLFLSVLVLGEIQKGVERLPPSRRKTHLKTWLHEDLRQRFEGRIWLVTEEVALTWGMLQGRAETQGRKLPVIDGLLAATAMTHDAILVTRDVPHFDGGSIESLNPWSTSI